MAKITYRADLQTYYFTMELVIELYHSISQCFTKNSIRWQLPHHHVIYQDSQCQPKVDLGKVLSRQPLAALYSNLVGQLITYYWMIFCSNKFSWLYFFNKLTLQNLDQCVGLSSLNKGEANILFYAKASDDKLSRQLYASLLYFWLSSTSTCTCTCILTYC